MDQITHQLRLEQWTQIIKECTASGMPKKLWLVEMASTRSSITTGSGLYAKKFSR